MDFTDYDTRLAAYAVIVDDRDRILLALFNQGPTPQWTLPGGGVELHETVEEATVRELREETGYDVELGRLLGVDSWVIPVEERIHRTERPLKSVRVMFEGRVVRTAGRRGPRWASPGARPAVPRRTPAGRSARRLPACPSPRRASRAARRAACR